MNAIRERLSEGKTKTGGEEPPKPGVRPGKWEVHLHPLKEGLEDTVLTEFGFLKFGPQFIAIVEGHADESQVRFAVGTHLVKYVKMIAEDGSIQGTLGL